MIKAAIIGASGYTGFELIKILSRHNKVEIVAANSESKYGKKVSDIYPEYDCDISFTNYGMDKINKIADIVFLAVREGMAKKIVPKVTARIIDLSPDYRLGSEAVYGLPELNREKISRTRFVANPGCYATAAILSALPMLGNNNLKNIIFDCKSGYSGAGKTPSQRNSPENLKENVMPYQLTNHEHIKEIEKALGKKVSFTPHVLPLFRGILCTSHFIMNEAVDAGDVKTEFIKHYEKEQFVKVVDRLPTLHDARNTNYCIIGGFEADHNNRIVIISALDNLLKGASGQAVQNMNIMFGIKESEGLL
ncbi:N-acetyl-gamma-glutamyl-phosphate reductase [Candidatus Woesearchaeota archaeon]|nr:N-acetyl-gamma-glutamyl-phosphate reductase [Candidatus Woesearchaeota archaeon]